MKMISQKRHEMGEEAWAEYQRLKANEKADRYRTKNGYHVVNWRRRTKIKLIEYKGEKCERCGYDKPCPSAYDFHHTDPSTKEFSISSGRCTKSIEKLKLEADKCQLLCKNCHAEVHDEKVAEARNQGLEDHAAWKDRLIERKNVQCPVCSIAFLQVWANQIHCSEKCAGISNRKVDRPSKEELKALLDSRTPWLTIGRKFGVTDNAARKWAISYGLEIPKRRSDRIPERQCEQCRKEFKPGSEEQNFCSLDCVGLSRRQVVRPSKEELQKMLETESYAEIARRYDVRRDTIVKWGVQYGIEPTARMKKHMEPEQPRSIWDEPSI